MSPRREALVFATTLAVVLGAFFHQSLLGRRVLSPADVLAATPGFEAVHGPGYEPANRLLIDPVLQFQPWLEFNRAELRRGRLPLWNPLAGCGAPHLANGQSAVFDPFHLIAYFGRPPGAYAAMAWTRLWFAGLGAFFLARRWRFGPWGRWFCGLAFPLCGFLVVWLLYPVTATAVWMPWVFLAADRLLDRPAPRAAGWLALAVGGMLLAGHVQTAAHVLLATACFALYRILGDRRRPGIRLLTCGAAVSLGVAIAAIELVPLGSYLARSPVWSDRQAEQSAPWTLDRPRLLDAVCTALPYAYGSQRRGQPNLARALGVHNLNESAGGFAGLATLLWLVPAAWGARARQPRVVFLAGLAGIGALGAFGVPPVSNLLRAVPVLEVIDHRRLTLWTAFGLVMLGGVGLDALGSPRRGPRGWMAAAVVLLLAVAAFRPVLGATIESRAVAHYAQAAAATPGADPDEFRQRARIQTDHTLRFVPRYYGLAAAHLIALAGLAWGLRSGRVRPDRARFALLALVLADLAGFGFGLNPATPRGDDRPGTDLIAYLQREAPPPSRFLALGAVLPPNTAMRYGLADVRNYDSVESSRNLDYFSGLYQPGRSRTSRRDVTWDGVARTMPRLKGARVAAVIGPTEPPPGLFDRVDRVGRLWVGRITQPDPGYHRPAPGRIETIIPTPHATTVRIAETFDPGWRALADGVPIPVQSWDGAFLAVAVPPGTRRVILRYDPAEVRIAGIASWCALFVTALTITAPEFKRRGRKTGSGSWSASSHRVRIRFMMLTRSLSPVSTEG